MSKALREVGGVLSKISQETSDRFALSVLETQSNCSNQEDFTFPTITIETKSLAESLGELTEEQSGLSLQYKDKMKAIKEFQEEDLPDL